MGGFWRVDIFCESGEAYGLGHFYRALKLASLLGRNPQVQAITIHNRGDFTPPPNLLPPSLLLPKCEIKHYEWLSTAPQMLDFAIIDSYEAEAWFYHRISHHAKALLCLDDTFRDVYPPSSYILNPTPNAAARYPWHNPAHLLCGVEYMLPLLSAEISTPALDSENSESETPESEMLDVFVSFGGVDRDNLTQSFVDTLLAQSMSQTLPFCFHVVLGGGYPHTLQVPPTLKPYIKVYQNLSPSDFLALAKSCRLAISAGGGSMLELLALQIPSIALEAAPNQSHQITHFASQGVIKHALDLSQAIALLPQLCDSYTFSAMKNALSHLGFGCKLEEALNRILSHITGEIQESSTEGKKSVDSKPLAIDFCDIDTAQSELVLNMRNHPFVASYMYATQITRPMHEQFLRALTNDKSRKYWLLYTDSEISESSPKSNPESSPDFAPHCLGVGSLTRINLTHAHAFIGIYASPFSPLPHKGSQILKFLESYAFDTLSLHALHLEVMENNTRAREFYTRHGYIEQGRLKGFVKREGEFVDVILMYKERA